MFDWILYGSFHEKDTESQRIVIENLSKYLLRKTYITNILIGKFKCLFEQLCFIHIDLDDLQKCFDSHLISPSLLTVLIDQISSAIKECYHAAPDSLLHLLFNGCNHSTVCPIDWIRTSFLLFFSSSSHQLQSIPFKLLRIFIVCIMSKIPIHHQHVLVLIVYHELFYTRLLNIRIYSYGKISKIKIKIIGNEYVF